METEGKLTVRRARPGDMDVVFEWTNDMHTRHNSFSSEPIAYSDHVKWFEKKITQENSRFYICEFSGEMCGQVRFDITEDPAEAVSGIIVRPSFRGRKLASEMLSSCSRIFFSEFPGVRVIIAYIKKTNEASLRSFLKAGFIQVKDQEVNKELCYRLELKK